MTLSSELWVYNAPSQLVKRLIPLLFTAALFAVAQKRPEEPAVANVPKAFADAMTNHDGHELAKIMASDVDFITVRHVASWPL